MTFHYQTHITYACFLQDVLESTFAHMKDKVTRMAKNQRASPYTLWMYATTSKYAEKGGLKQARF